MGNKPRTITELLGDLGERHAALCAFNVESFDTLHPALRAAADTGCPVVIAYSVPAAQYLGFAGTAALVETVADWYPSVEYALHLDHCEDPDDLRAAIDAGFTGGNFLNEGQLSDHSYLAAAVGLQQDLGGRASLEFVLGQLGHVDHEHEIAPIEALSVEAVARFAAACTPDILGFDCGSKHGMRTRTQPIATDLISGVAEATGLPIVLHGSSGVTPEQVRAGIDAGIRKVNIETALRTTYMNTVRVTLAGGGPGARKPRYLTRATDETMHALYTTLLTDYTLRKA